jgi:glycosyltransferase involved in cell wall biosynthesis
LPADRPLRVAYVVKRFPRYSETFIVNELLAHEAAGCEIEVFSLRPSIDTHFQDTLARLRAPVRYVASESVKPHEYWTACKRAFEAVGSLDVLLCDNLARDGHDVYQAVLLARSLRDGGFDHIHAHFASLPATVARMAARLTGLPWTFTAHAKDIFHDTVDAEDLARKCRDAAAVVTVSDFNQRYLREQCGDAGCEIVRIYNGLDLDAVPFGRDTPRPVDVLAVGRLVEKKGFDVLIDACAQLARTGHTIRCEIVGEGELEPALRDRIASLGLGDIVRMPGPRPQREVIEGLRSARIFAAPCLVASDGNRDGLPTTILEAMASGAVCISTPVTGIPEVVRHRETGVLVPSGDPQALAATIRDLLASTEERRRIASAARTLIDGAFDSRVTAAQLRALFGRCAASTRMRAIA